MIEATPKTLFYREDAKNYLLEIELFASLRLCGFKNF